MQCGYGPHWPSCRPIRCLAKYAGNLRRSLRDDATNFLTHDSNSFEALSLHWEDDRLWLCIGGELLVVSHLALSKVICGILSFSVR